MCTETKKKDDANSTTHLNPNVRKVYFTGVVHGLEELQILIEGQLSHAEAALALADDELVNSRKDNDQQPKKDSNHEHKK